jgi:hypothetical protein
VCHSEEDISRGNIGFLDPQMNSRSGWTGHGAVGVIGPDTRSAESWYRECERVIVESLLKRLLIKDS